MRIRDILTVLGITLLLAAGGIATAVLGHREFSENENRYLAQFPALHADSVLSGEAQQDIIDAFNDQFPGRDYFTAAATGVKKAVGFQDIGGVYIGKDHYYFEKILDKDISEVNYFQNLRFVNVLASLQPDARIGAMLVPSPGTVLSEKLPDHAVLYDADRMYQQAADTLKGVAFLDIREVLKAEGASSHIYYKTDHHWTQYGAYLGYSAYQTAYGMIPQPYDYFGITFVSDSFYGSLYSKVLDSGAAPDELDVPTDLPPVRVLCDGKQADGIYDESKQKEKDKYAIYFGGNFGEVQIDMTSPKTKKKLLLIKDSFANSMVPFLLKDYAQIRMIDLRYFKGSVKDYLEENGFDEILVLYEMSNFAQDTNLNKLTK